MEIKKAINRINVDAAEYLSELEIFPLHSMLTSSEQSSVFRKMKPGKRKIVVSTNIAETSVTIDDVVFCIDTGRVKEMKLVNSVLSLTEVWASKASCKQRKGRAGRVKAGKCFKLFTSYFEGKFMKAHSEPEILRLPLEQLCLQIKAMGILDVSDFLGKALSPPPIANIKDALDLLESVNALGEDGKLTPLGHHVSLLPTDVRVAKMLIFGAIFHCLDPILTIAACISGKGPFNSPLDKRQEATEAQRKFALHKSDFLAASLAFDGWSLQKGMKNQRVYCEENYLSMTNLTAMQDLRKQFVDLLRDIGYVSRDNYESLNEFSKNDKIVKSVILAGLFPNIAGIKMPKQVFNKTAEGAVAIDAQSKEIKYFAAGERVFIHPSSQLFSEQKYEESVLVYGTKVSTSKIFLRDCSVAPSCALLLLGGKVAVLHGGNSVEISSVRFQAIPRVSSLVMGMRALLNIALQEKIKNPTVDVIQTEIGRLCLDLLLI
jgi:HrpA-like RNA helicase